MSTICDLQYFAGKANELYLLRDRVAELEELLGLGRNITPEIVRLGFSPSEAAVLGVLLQRNGFARPEFIWSALYGSTRDCDQPDIKIIDVWLSKIRTQLVDSTVATTRAFWRAKVGYPQFSDDPRPLAECLRGEK